MKNKLHSAIKILLAILITVSCDFPQEGGGGSLTVVLPEGDQNSGMARSVLSDSFTPTLRYRITLTGPGGEILEQEAVGGSVTVSLSPGVWTITVEAREGATLVGTGTETAIVVPGQPVSVSVKMTVDPAYASLLAVIYIHNEAELRAFLAASANKTGRLERDISVVGSPAGDLDGTGTLDGQGHTITLDIDVTTGTDVGLLAENYGTVKNLRLEGTVSVNVTSGAVDVGAVAGWNQGGTIRNVFSNVTVTASNTDSSGGLNAGGIAGYNDGTIENCSAGGDITGSIFSPVLYVGGIAGNNTATATIRQCYAWGKVSSNNASGPTGGIAGYNANRIEMCVALNSKIDNTDLSTNSPSYQHRIVGENTSFLSRNYAYEDMVFGTPEAVVTGIPPTSADEHGENLDVVSNLDNNDDAKSWWTMTIPGWTIETSKATASEASPWYWSKTILIPGNTLNMMTDVTAYVPALWFERP